MNMTGDNAEGVADRSWVCAEHLTRYLLHRKYIHMGVDKR